MHAFPALAVEMTSRHGREKSCLFSKGGQFHILHGLPYTLAVILTVI